MYISLSLLVFFFMGSAAKKEGNFGSFTACITKNGTLRLNCFYASCPNSASYNCTFRTADRVVVYKASGDKCKYVLPDQAQMYANQTLTYNCTLTRRNRKEEKQITIDLGLHTGKKPIKLCPNTTGLRLHQASISLWPVVILSLWRILDTDSQTT